MNRVPELRDTTYSLLEFFVDTHGIVIQKKSQNFFVMEKNKFENIFQLRKNIFEIFQNPKIFNEKSKILVLKFSIFH